MPKLSTPMLLVDALRFVSSFDQTAVFFYQYTFMLLVDILVKELLIGFIYLFLLVFLISIIITVYSSTSFPLPINFVPKRYWGNHILGLCLVFILWTVQLCYMNTFKVHEVFKTNNFIVINLRLMLDILS